MRKLIATGSLLLTLTGLAHGGEDLQARARKHFQPIPFGVPEIKDNPITEEKIALGKMLYFEPRLSRSGLVSCNFCHNLGMGGDDSQETATGHGWQKGPRNSPTVLNAVFNLAQFWDGRARDLKEQAKGPVQASVEMNNTPQAVLKTLHSMPEYVARFQRSFPDDREPVSFDNMAAAIEAFEATLTTPDAPFDRFLRGEKAALSPEATKGLELFMDKGCVECHGGMNLGGRGYFAFGVVAKPASELLAGDQGRMKVTAKVDDEYVFKAPSLRNIKLTPPYFHSGKVWSLEEAVRLMGSTQLGIELDSAEAGLITTFLKTTTGRQPRVEYPLLPPSTRLTPRPALD